MRLWFALLGLWLLSKWEFQEPPRSQVIKGWKKYARESEEEERRRLALGAR